MTVHHIQYGTTTIKFDLTYTRRKTLGITVYPDKRVIVRAPLGTSLADVETVVLKKGSWIVKKQQAFAEYPPAPPRAATSAVRPTSTSAVTTV